LCPNFTPRPFAAFAGAGPFAYQAALKLGQYAYHLPHDAACRRLRVDRLGEGTEPFMKRRGV
jgi:hypothetical protein